MTIFVRTLSWSLVNLGSFDQLRWEKGECWRGVSKAGAFGFGHLDLDSALTQVSPVPPDTYERVTLHRDSASGRVFHRISPLIAFGLSVLGNLVPITLDDFGGIDRDKGLACGFRRTGTAMITVPADAEYPSLDAFIASKIPSDDA